MNDLFQKALAASTPFVLYRKPNISQIVGWFQKNKVLNTTTELTKSCFVFAPFHENEKIVFYPEDCDITHEFIDFSVEFSQDIPAQTNSVEKEKHLLLVNKGIQAIHDGLMEKVVLSRKETVTIEQDKYPIYFQRLIKKYPTAFVYWFYHPNVGMWMGATPEQLVKINNNVVQTVSLAGTINQPNADLKNIIWGKKEQNEQQVVTDFIMNALKPLSDNLQATTPYSYQAGSLVHIKTDITAVLKNTQDAYKAVVALHPTPALCGFPKKEAQKFIIENEGYNREFYGGYLGEWKFNNLDYSTKSDLFVNLRCMKIDNNQAYLFLGGGINKDSIPENEYEETVNKSKTIKSVL